MKFYLIAVIAALMVSTSIKAQDTNIGIKGGLNLYNIANKNSTNDALLGFHVGLIGHIHINDNFAVQPEVVFSTQGAEFEPLGTKVNLNLNYINVPVLLQYMFDNGFRFQAGPQLGFLVSANTEVDNTVFDRRDDFNSIDLGATFGIGYINPNSNFGIDARYNHGLTDFDKNSAEVSYNRGYQVGVFYLFSHK
ncbi:MAG: porin family protein [Candidatus Cyclobacteriaceae bacterium M2_1C_046]